MTGKIKDMLIADPKQYFRKELLQTIESTGRGNDLCYEFYLGRLFRDDAESCRDNCLEYSRIYRESCERLDEDPAHAYYEVQNFNDLYKMIGIRPSGAGDSFGYTNDDEWRVSSIDWDFEWVESGPMADEFGEKIFFFGPREYCVPQQYYREV